MNDGIAAAIGFVLLVGLLTLAGRVLAPLWIGSGSRRDADRNPPPLIATTDSTASPPTRPSPRTP